jgi:Protein of unknown function (DUF2975)
MGPQQRLQRQARLFRIFATWAACLSVLAVLTQIASVAAPLWRGGPIFPTLLDTLKQLVLTAPALFYVAGLIRGRRVFDRIGSGEVFVRENSEGLVGVGAALLAGSVWALLAAGLEPTIHSNGLGPVARDIADGASQLALAALGLALLMIGRVMRAAVRLKAETDGFV